MIVFTFRKCSLVLDFSFFAVIAVYCLIDSSELAIYTVVACLLHEIGHLLAMYISGVGPDKLVFFCAGISIGSVELDFAPFKKKIFILSAGVLVNLLCSLFFYLLGHELFSAMHLAIGLFNFFPVGNLDGARILQAVLSRFIRPHLVDKLRKYIALGFVFVVLIVELVFNISAYAMLVTALFFLIMQSDNI